MLLGSTWTLSTRLEHPAQESLQFGRLFVVLKHFPQAVGRDLVASITSILLVGCCRASWGPEAELSPGTASASSSLTL